LSKKADAEYKQNIANRMQEIYLYSKSLHPVLSAFFSVLDNFDNAQVSSPEYNTARQYALK